MTYFLVERAADLTSLEVPYPFQIDPDGNIGGQTFWSGTPRAALGFADVPLGSMTLPWSHAVAQPDRAIGKHLITVDTDGALRCWSPPVERMTLVQYEMTA